MLSLAKLGNQLYTGQRSFGFVQRRKVWYLIAAVTMLISLGGVLGKGLTPTVEFTGGSELRVESVQNADESKARDAVKDVLGSVEARVSTVNNAIDQTQSIRVQVESITPEQTTDLTQALSQAYGVDRDAVSANFIGASWGEDVTRKSIQGLVIFLILVALLIAIYFRTAKMALAAIAALAHDLVITVGVYALVGFEVSPATVIGFLTILGYSLYDTVVVFDKVRENTEHVMSSTRRTFAEACNLAVNQTLVRSINTSVVALLPVASILFIGAFVLGAGTLKDIALALFVGIAAGTYSSVFIATPLLVDLRRNEPSIQAQEARVLRKRAEDANPESAAATALATPAPLREASGGQRSQPKRNKPRR